MRTSLKIALPVLVAAVLNVGVVLAEPGKQQSGLHEKHAAVCSPAAGTFRCHARVIVENDGITPKVTAIPAGYGPQQLRQAYNVTGASTKVIAIVDAYDHSNILSDLNTYSNTYGISTLPACVGPVASSPVACFQKLSQNGRTKYPAPNAGWALEIALDVETAHAMCPTCSILLVEANSARFSDLMSAVDTAVKNGAAVVSNSYGGSEFSGETSYDFHFKVPGVAFTVSSGDSSYGVEYPAASQYVTAVGGTSLFLNVDGSYNSESTWSGAGSGCSAYEPKPLFQSDSACANRTVADVSAVADPNTGAAVYDSVSYQGRKGWLVVGGTSLASPIIAAMYAQGGVSDNANSLPYANQASLHDVISGSNGSCGGSYLCTAGFGYDGPTGLGTPNGVGAF